MRTHSWNIDWQGYEHRWRGNEERNRKKLEHVERRADRVGRKSKGNEMYKESWLSSTSPTTTQHYDGCLKEKSES